MKPRRIQLSVEGLESREVPASLGPTALTAPATLAAATPDGPVTYNGEDYARTIRFAGKTWGVVDSGADKQGPGDNYFSGSPSAVFVDNQGRLHLRVTFLDGQWRSSEVALLESNGYGTYAVQTASNLARLPNNVTAGFFTYDSNAPDPYRELDFEDGKFADPAQPNNTQFVVQPWDHAGNTKRYLLPDLSGDPSLTRAIRWEPGQVTFYTANGFQSAANLTATNQVFRVANSAGHVVVPVPGTEIFRINLWVYPGGAPATGQITELIVKDFSFTPLANSPANHAPIIGQSAPTLTPARWNAPAPSGAVGTLVSTLAARANITDPDAGAKTGIAVTAVDRSEGTWYFTTNSGQTWSALAPGQNASRLLAANAATRVYFRPAAGVIGTDAASLTFRAWDQTRGVNGKTADTTAVGGASPFSSGTATAFVSVNSATAVNHAPVPGVVRVALDPVPRNAPAPRGAVGTLVSVLVSRANITDADAGAERGIAVTATDSLHGTWYYSVNNGTTWLPLTASVASSRLLAADAWTRVCFRPAANFSGVKAASLTFRAWDQTRGASGAHAATIVNGGESPFSSATVVAEITVN